MASRKQATWYPEGAAHRQDARGPAGPGTINLPPRTNILQSDSIWFQTAFRQAPDRTQSLLQTGRSPLFGKKLILALKKSYGTPMRGRTAGTLVPRRLRVVGYVVR